MTGPRPAPTLGARLERAARSSARIRFLDHAERATHLSMGDIHRRALATAAVLRAMGVGTGDRIALVLPTAPSFFDAFFGAGAAGAVPVPLSPPVRLGKLDEYHTRTAQMLRACDARMVLTDRRIRRLLGRTAERARPPLGCHALEDLGIDLDAEPAGALSAPAPDDLAFVQFSSGTTALPKPVALTHAQVLANVDAILAAMTGAHPQGPELTHAGVSWLPLYHDMGLVGCVLVAVSHPGDLTLIPPEVFVARPASWLQAISTYRGTISPAPNFAYALCAERVTDEELVGVDLSSWRIALNGAEPVTYRALERFVTRFEPHGLHPAALSPVYGLAEATLAVTFTDLRERFRHRDVDRDALLLEGRARSPEAGRPRVTLVSVGRALPGFEVRIVPAEGEGPVQARPALEPGRLGRVLVRGPSVMRGYLDRPEATAEALRDGWLDTGDTGFALDEQLYLYGRAKELVILAGRKHAPQPIEQAVDGVSGVRPGCVAAIGVVPDGGDAEGLVVLVERARAARQSDADIAAEASRRITAALGLVPWKVEVLRPGTLPRTSSGKIRRAAAREAYLAGRLSPPDEVTPWRLALEAVRSSLGFARARISGAQGADRASPGDAAARRRGETER